MDIKEIALRIAEETDAKYPWNMNQGPWIVSFAEALTPEYRAELLKEVGEPVLYAEFAEDGGWLGDASEYADHLEEPHALFTSDQLAAAIIKATKPLEDQLAAAQEEIKTVTEQKNRMWFEMQTAQDQLAKAEQRVAEYNELIYAVQTKHHDETRHQTALRYIRNAENRPSNAVANGASI